MTLAPELTAFATPRGGSPAVDRHSRIHAGEFGLGPLSLLLFS